MRTKSQRKKSHEDKITEEKIPWGQNPRGQNPKGQNPIRKKSHVGKYLKKTKSHKEKNTRKYSIVLVSLEYILRSHFSKFNVKNLRIFCITYTFFAHYLCFTFIVRWRACTRLCSLYLRNSTDNSSNLYNWIGYILKAFIVMVTQSIKVRY